MNSKKVALYGILISLAFIFSYIDLLFPGTSDGSRSETGTGKPGIGCRALHHRSIGNHMHQPDPDCAFQPFIWSRLFLHDLQDCQAEC